MDSELFHANERLKGRRVEKNHPVGSASYQALALESIRTAKETGVLDLKRERVSEWESEQRDAKVEVYLRNFRRALPEHYKSYTVTPPPKHAGNLKARQALERFKLDDALHLYGDP